jgi:hypothetical protein
LKVQHDARIGGRKADTLQTTSVDGLGNRNGVAPLGIFELDRNTRRQNALRRELLLVKQRRALEEKDYSRSGGIDGSSAIHVNTD